MFSCIIKCFTAVNCLNLSSLVVCLIMFNGCLLRMHAVRGTQSVIVVVFKCIFVNVRKNFNFDLWLRCHFKEKTNHSKSRSEKIYTRSIVNLGVSNWWTKRMYTTRIFITITIIYCYPPNILSYNLHSKSSGVFIGWGGGWGLSLSREYSCEKLSSFTEIHFNELLDRKIIK